MSGPIVLEGLDLAALLCSRVCHDLISPVGAITNGLEVMEEGKDEETAKFAMDLIKKSARTASAKLQFCRLAFGAAGSAGAQIDTGDAEKVDARPDGGRKDQGRLESAARAAGQEPGQAAAQHDAARRPRRSRAAASSPSIRSARATPSASGSPATGTNAKVPQAIPPLLAGGSAEHPVDAHAIQPFYTSLLAKNCGLERRHGGRGRSGGGHRAADALSAPRRTLAVNEPLTRRR